MCTKAVTISFVFYGGGSAFKCVRVALQLVTAQYTLEYTQIMNYTDVNNTSIDINSTEQILIIPHLPAVNQRM